MLAIASDMGAPTQAARRGSICASALASLVIACGGTSGPAAPSNGSGTPSQTVSVVSGDTGAPVSNARVIAGGVTYTTNASGQAVLPGELTAAATVDLEISGFLKRETTLAGGPQFSLWPSQAQGAAEAWTQQVLHGTFGTSSMLRPDPQLRQYTILPDAAVASDPSALLALERAAAMWNAATGASFTMRVGSGAPVNGLGVVVATIDPTSPSAGGAAPLGTGRALSGGTISFRSIAVARLPNVVAHELGHMFGVGHSPDASDVMYSASPAADLSMRERMTARLMLQRRPGKNWPDNERALGVQGTSEAPISFRWFCGLFD